jgi:sec-independent protein translocase protein TatC
MAAAPMVRRSRRRGRDRGRGDRRLLAAIAPEAKSPESGKELSILEHLQELRQRLVISAAALVIGFAASLFLTKRFLEWITAPATNAGQDVSIVFTDVLGYWGAYFRVALLASVAMAMPILVYEVLAFISPGLTKQDGDGLSPSSSAHHMFVAGCVFAYYVDCHRAPFLLNSGDNIKPMINASRVMSTS